MPRRILPILAVLSLLLLGACQKKDEFKPSKLVGPLYSGKSLQAVERELDLKAGDWDVLEDRRPLTSDKRPPYRIYTLSKKEFPLLGVPGHQLIMTFYNDRLMTVQFYPYSADTFRAALVSQDNVGFSRENDAFVEPSTRIWVGKDLQKHTYFGFVDRALQQESDNWIRTYSNQQ